MNHDKKEKEVVDATKTSDTCYPGTTGDADSPFEASPEKFFGVASGTPTRQK